MKALQALAFASILLFLLAPHAVGGETGTVASFDAAACLSDGASTLPSFMLPIEASWGLPSLPSCFSIEGTACSNPGSPGVRCMWQMYEPGICFCQASSYTMVCG